ncbi:hypothetical protein PFICI_02251 [Pestalotiopsis fici W106-1]|uniref:LYC1 C-terminal domain-containing protein n=1 Tax=Pestalotiopsis fici (strain W106-1 / CGMCC3.15140) TaxID=1229662 RepID=W3XGB6_PESFW|nr:uncharacterized protein PFICI_02251 [Pestalotiopsis fici W106-1]ETS84226.1 hypothetical protein PFICI_02251 [Pestalotiopsis fici W106-1]
MTTIQLPASDSLSLHLTHPTSEECIHIWSSTAALWKDSLTVPLYVAEAEFLTTVPLAKDGGMTTWVLVDKNLPPHQRQVLCSCETFRKRALMSDDKGNIEEVLVHGVASVFSPPAYRGRGYGIRHMKELSKVLRGWQAEHGKSFGSVLYSEIGKEYYAKMGWMPNSSNGHFILPSIMMEKPAMTQPVAESNLESLCLRDEAMVHEAMASPSTKQSRVVVLPSLDHMLWHIRKEEFVTNYIFGKKAEVKGAIAGSPGKQVWALWVHRYYEHPDHAKEKEGDDGNVLYILRLVVEGDDTANKPHEDNPAPLIEAYMEQAAALKAVIQAAQAEAAEWKLDQVRLWEPSPLVHNLLEQSDIQATWVERHESSVACALWFKEDNAASEEDPTWVNNQHHAWC